MADLMRMQFESRVMGRWVDIAQEHGDLVMNLYCWPHRVVHAVPLADVEKIVYALGPAPTDAYFSGYDDGGDNWGEGNKPTRTRDYQPCWLEVLKWADDAEMYAEHVEQGIECRERS
jgi:hypothetical protein